MIFRNGLPNMCNRLATMLRNIQFNSVSLAVGGTTGISANSIVDNMSGLLGIPSKAFGESALTVGSVLAGEEDKKALREMLKDALILALKAGLSLAFVVALGAGLITQMYISKSDPAFRMVRLGIMWWGISLIPYTVNLVMIN